MALLETSNTHIHQVSDILDHYEEWYMQVLRASFYKAHIKENILPESPAILDEWLEKSAARDDMDAGTIDMLHTICDEIKAFAVKLFESAEPGNIPEMKQFDDFRDMYEDFTSRLKRIEKEGGTENTDIETGFRTMDVFLNDVKREQDRTARSDKPFCLSFIRINNFDVIKQAGKEEQSRAIEQVTEAIRHTLRTFDDAYRYDDASFYFSLKNTGAPGAQIAINRLNTYMKSKNMSVMKEGQRHLLTTSASIAEVQSSDDIQKLTDLLKRDVEKADQSPGTILQLQEKSALEQFLSEKDV